MPIISMRDLSRQTAGVVHGLHRDRPDTIVTHRGRPVARLSPLTEEEYEDYLLSQIANALPPLRGGETLTPLADVLREEGVLTGRSHARRSR